MKAAITVIMGIYNCEKTLQDSLESLLAQTIQDFCVILCEDGSSDHTYEVAKEYVERYPDKFKLIRNEKNKGLTYSLNRCLALAKSELIARQDGDDVSLPRRFEEEVKFLEEHPDYDFVSTAMEYCDEKGVWMVGNPIEDPTKYDFRMGSPFCHAPCMIRKKAIDAVNGYRDIEKTKGVEDYDLWFRLYGAGFKGHNIKQPLYRMFDGRDAAARRTIRRRLNEAWVMRKGFQLLKLPVWNYIFTLKPVILAFVPRPIYLFLRKLRGGSAV